MHPLLWMTPLVVVVSMLLVSMLDSDVPTGDYEIAESHDVDEAPTLGGARRSYSQRNAGGRESLGATFGRTQIEGDDLVIRGVVIDGSARPVAGAEIRACVVLPTQLRSARLSVLARDYLSRARHRAHSPNLELAQGASDQAGHFALRVHRHAQICIRAQHDEIGAATRFVVPTGSKRSKPVTLLLSQTERLRLQVVDETRMPMTGVEVRLSSSHTPDTVRTFTNRVGEVTYFHRPNSDVYAIVVRKDGLMAVRTIDTETESDVVLTMPAGPDHPLVVYGLPSGLSTDSCRATITASIDEDLEILYSTTLNARGEGLLQGVPPSTLKEMSLRIGESAPFLLSRGHISMPSVFLASPATKLTATIVAPGRIVGRAVGHGGAIPGAHVVLLRLGKNTYPDEWMQVDDVAAYALSDDSGTFAFAHAPPGAYGLVIESSGERRQLALLPELLSSEGPEEGLLLSPAETLDLGDVSCVQAATLTGEVLPNYFYDAGTRVTIASSNGLFQGTVSVDSQGRFRADSVPAETELTVCLSSSNSIRRQVSVAHGTSAHVELELDTPMWVTGTVRDEQGAPVVGARVHAWRALGDYRDEFLGNENLVSTEDGSFRVPFFPFDPSRLAGSDGDKEKSTARWGITAIRDGYVSNDCDDQTWPSAPLGAARLRCDVVLERLKRVELAGTVQQADGQLASTAIVTIRACKDQRQRTRTDEAGRFHWSGLGMPDARVLHIEHESGTWDYGDVDFVEQATYVLSPVRDDNSIEGRFLHPQTSQPLGGDVALYRLNEDDASTNELLASRREASATERPTRLAWSDFQLLGELTVAGTDSAYHGSFGFEKVEPGTYVLAIRPKNTGLGGYMPSAFGPFSLPQSNLTIYAELGRVMQGQVLDENGRGVHDAVVIAGYESSTKGSTTGESRPSARTGFDGRFSLGGIPDKTISLIAWKQGYIPTLVKPESLSDGMSVELKKGWSLSGRVLDPDGKPWPYAEIEFKCLDDAWSRIDAQLETIGGGPWLFEGGSLGPNAWTDGRGNFKVSGLPKATYRVVPDHKWQGKQLLFWPPESYEAGKTQILIRSVPRMSVSGLLEPTSEVDPASSESWYVQVRIQGEPQWFRSYGDWVSYKSRRFHIDRIPPGDVEICVWHSVSHVDRRPIATRFARAGDKDVRIPVEVNQE